MGTLVEVSIAGNGKEAKSAVQAVFDEFKRIEDLTSFHKPSEIGKINDLAGTRPVAVSPEVLELVEKSLQMAELTDGAFDPTIGVITNIWHFSAGQPRLPSPEEISEQLGKVNWRKIEINKQAGTVFLSEKGMMMDLGGIAKGYALLKSRDVLSRLNIRSALVNAGGDILAIGGKEPGKPWRVGVQHPRKTDAMIAVANLADRLIITSGDYERFFRENNNRYHHILDPKTGYPTQGLQSVTIITPDNGYSDGLSTAVFVLGLEKGSRFLEQRPNTDALLVDSDGKIHITGKNKNTFEPITQ